MSARKNRRNQVLAAAITAISCWGLSHPASAQFLSVDLNGGDSTTPNAGGTFNNASTNLGWDGTVNQPVNGVTWTPWGGHVGQGGDGTNPLPFNPASPVMGLSKTFTSGAVASGAVTVTLTAEPGTGGFNSRDRGTSEGTTNNADMYRDLVFLARNTGNQTGGSPIIITLSGLNKNTTYSYTAYAVDEFDTGQYLFGEVDPTVYNYAPPTNQVENSGVFANPPSPIDSSLIGQRITGLNVHNYQPPPGLTDFPASNTPLSYASTFNITTDNNGNATFYEWSDANVNNGGNTQTAAIMNGLQIGTVASSTWTLNNGSAAFGSGFTTVPDGDNKVANFGTVTSAQNVVIESTGRTLGVLNVLSPTAYTFSSGSSSTGTLTMSGSFAPDPINGSGQAGDGNPYYVSDTVGHAAINILGDSTFTVQHTISAPVVLANHTSINVAPTASSLKMTGQISGASSGLNKLGAGAVILTGNNTYGGPTNVFTGRLIVNGNTSGGGDYTVAAGATLAGSGTLGLRDDVIPPINTNSDAQPGKVNAWNGAVISPGDSTAVNTVGVLTMDRLAVGSPAFPVNHGGGGSITISIELGSGAADKLNITDSGGLDFANTGGSISFNVASLSGATTGIYTILDYAGSIMDTSASLAGTPITPGLSRFGLTSTSIGGFTLGLIDDTANTSIDLQVALAGPSAWTGSLSSSWSSSGNWSGIVPNGVDSVANFGTVASNQYAVNVDGAKIVGLMSITYGGSYTLSGSTITFQAASGAPAIVTTAGNHTISAPVQMNNFLFVTVANSSALTISTLVPTVSGRELSVGGTGTLTLGSGPNFNISGGAGTILVGGTSTLKFAHGPNNSTAGTSITSSLGIAGVMDAWTAKVDLTDNGMIVDYPTAGPSPLATMQNQLKQGFNGGSWNGTGGILSSDAAAAAATPGAHQTALGYGEASTLGVGSFNGVTLADNTAVLVKYTWSGDANLDGKVDTSDFAALSGSFGSTTAVWTQGDFNYDGKVNALDFNAIAANYGQLASGLPASAPLLGSLVPEPTMLGLLAGAVLLGGRRRRQA